MKFKCPCGSEIVTISQSYQVQKWVMCDTDWPPDGNIKWSEDAIHDELWIARCESCDKKWKSWGSLYELMVDLRRLGVLI